MTCKAGTIAQIHERLLQEGYFVSQYALRRWIADGSLPAVRSGKKFFITYENTLARLTNGTVAPQSAS